MANGELKHYGRFSVCWHGPKPFLPSALDLVQIWTNKTRLPFEHLPSALSKREGQGQLVFVREYLPRASY